MAIKFTLLKKKSLKTKTLQWFATPKSNYTTGAEATSSESSQGSTISDIETEATLRQVGQYIPRELIKGNTVKVPGLGTFRVSFHSKGTDDISKFDAKKMISGAHVVFLPEKSLKAALANQIGFQNAGVKVGDVIYPSVADYLRAQGTTPGGDGNEGGETPGGTTPDPNQGGGNNNGGGEEPGGDGIE